MIRFHILLTSAKKPYIDPRSASTRRIIGNNNNVSPPSSRQSNYLFKKKSPATNLFFLVLVGIINTGQSFSSPPSFSFRRNDSRRYFHSTNRRRAIASIPLLPYKTPALRMSSDSTTTTSNGNSGLVIVGSANQDLISYTPRLPDPGETILGAPASSVGDEGGVSEGKNSSFEILFGGKGANQAVAAGLLGFTDVWMVCKVGKDDFGGQIVDNFLKSGVKHTPLYAPPPTPTGVASINVDHRGENTIVVHGGANAELSPSDVETFFSSPSAPTPKVVLSQLETPSDTVAHALKCGRGAGAVSILNPAPVPPAGIPTNVWENVDILIPNETEMRLLLSSCDGVTDDMDEVGLASLLLRERPSLSTVICTLGSRGAVILRRGDDGKITTDHIPIPDIPSINSLPVIDTIGAGDAFCGAFASYLAAGVSDLSQAARMACGVASMSVRKKGAMTSYPSREELPEMLRCETTGSRPDEVAAATITFVTGNEKKLQELRRMIEGQDVPFSFTHEALDLPELQGDDPLVIATEKCALASREVSSPGGVLIEDTSLSFHALGGLPGPYIKWFLEKCGHGGLNNMLVGFDDKGATARTVLAFCPGRGRDVELFVGETIGKVVPARGKTDFGWDAVFEPEEGGGKTYGEMSKDEKDAISHRGRAFAKFRDYLISR